MFIVLSTEYNGTPNHNYFYASTRKEALEVGKRLLASFVDNPIFDEFTVLEYVKILDRNGRVFLTRRPYQTVGGVVALIDVTRLLREEKFVSDLLARPELQNFTSVVDSEEPLEPMSCYVCSQLLAEHERNYILDARSQNGPIHVCKSCWDETNETGGWYEVPEEPGPVRHHTFGAVENVNRTEDEIVPQEWEDF